MGLARAVNVDSAERICRAICSKGESLTDREQQRPTCAVSALGPRCTVRLALLVKALLHELLNYLQLLGSHALIQSRFEVGHVLLEVGA